MLPTYYTTKKNRQGGLVVKRWTANPMCSARVGSNPILVDTFC